MLSRIDLKEFDKSIYQRELLDPQKKHPQNELSECDWCILLSRIDLKEFDKSIYQRELLDPQKNIPKNIQKKSLTTHFVNVFVDIFLWV